ncbi:uncharacterized protein [Typha angustifolia]|uniref:uncharacterized protein n=1 Tax=Typha angustifolia TaxID=59011 RepID=UPI003C2AC1D9
MDVSVEKPGTSDSTKRSRSLDLQSIYARKSRSSARKSWSKKGSAAVNRESKASKRKRSSTLENRVSVRRKRSKTEVSFSAVESASKRQRNSLNALRVNTTGSVSGIEKKETVSSLNASAAKLDTLTCSVENLGDDIPLPLAGQEHLRTLSIRNLENLIGSGDRTDVPKRPRGVLRQKKPENSNSLKRFASNFCGKSSHDAHNDEKSGNIFPSTEVLTCKRKKRSNDFKENRVGGENSIDCFKNATSNSVQLTRRNDCSRKHSSKVKKAGLSDKTPIHDDGGKFYGDLQEDDEENLEQNAARMLCSLFDPVCSGFPGNRTSSPSKSVNGPLPPQSAHENIKGSQIEVTKVVGAGRVLRPRKCYGDSFSRKRRHFYEVYPKDLNPFCIVKQRIRVFWPLDKSWYFGRVKEYDPVTRLHYVRYDDRDKEWIDLRNERFKLLLFPSEVASIYNKRSGLATNLNYTKEKEYTDDSSMDSSTESEPIISWLAQSAHRAKSSPANTVMRQNHGQPTKDSQMSYSFEASRCMDVTPSNIDPNILFNSSIMPQSSIKNTSEVSLLNSRSGARDRKFSFVYFRRRFRKRLKSFVDILEHESSPGNTMGSISIFASVSDRTSAAEEHCAATTLLELTPVMFRLSLLLHYIYKCVYGADSVCLSRALFFLQYGKLMRVWPMVHLEIAIFDNALGFRYFLIEVCLKLAVSLVCLLIGTFHQCTQQFDFKEMQTPFTSIRFKISGMHERGSQIMFVLFSFFRLESSSWVYLDQKLKHHCVKLKELPKADCSYSNIKNFTDGNYQIVPTSPDPILPEGLSKEYDKGLMHQLLFGKSDANLVICPLDEKDTTPLVLLGFHLKFLTENNVSSIRFQNPISFVSEERTDNDKLRADVCSHVEDPSDQASAITLEMIGYSSGQAASSSGGLTLDHAKVLTDALSASNDGDWMRPSINSFSREVTVTGSTEESRDDGKNKDDSTVVQFERLSCETGSCPGADKQYSSHSLYFTPDKSEGGPYSCEDTPNKDGVGMQSAPNLVSEMNGHSIRFAKPTAPRSAWHRNHHISVSRSFGYRSRLWLEDSMRNGFVSGSKKPRSQVSYSFCPQGDELSSDSRNNHRKAYTYKNVKRLSGSSGTPDNFLDSLICHANVLITVGDRGWRECGAQVLLEFDDQQEWRICIKLSGVIKYIHKASHILQPGTTNRYTHAMMWKGGKDWYLEFPDRGQWSLFKQMHEECYNRNIRAASIKNIPTPGVRMVAGGHNVNAEVPFLRSSKYIRQVGTEIDMALDPAHVLYDMDSGDEEWVSKLRFSDSKAINISEVTEDLFERVMDTFEKLAYAHHCDEFNANQIAELMANVGPLDIIEVIHEYWRVKRQKKGLPLIRQFQPALWMFYQKQLKEWESAMSIMCSSRDSCQDKERLIKKPLMFAFCLRPRGLELPNKGLKQRSHKKILFPGHHNSFVREQNCFYNSGRKLAEVSVREEKAILNIPSYESSDSFGWHQSSSSISPKDTVKTESQDSLPYYDVTDRGPPPKSYICSVKKRRMFPSSENCEVAPFLRAQRFKRNGACRRGADMYELSKPNKLPFDTFQDLKVDLDEVRLRDASSAAQHALTMAKLKREKAQWLLHKADLALHRATVALMTAEAIKSSERDLIGAG